MNKKLFNILSYLFVGLLLVTAVSFAGSLTPPGSVANTMYSLTDIFNLSTGITTTVGSGTISATPGTIASSGKTLTEVYTALSDQVALLANAKIAKDVTAFGYTGTLYGDTDPTKVLTTATYAGTASAGGLPKTGQTTCWDTDGFAQNPCLIGTSAEGGQDGYSQEGIAPAYVDNGNGTITDNATGLIWQKQDDGVLRSWTNSLAYCNANTAGLPGTGWRMPNIKELFSIVDFKDNTYPTPAINTVFFPNTPGDEYYWSSTNYQTDTNQDRAWTVSSYNGQTKNYAKNYFLGHYVRCVR